jgi:serine/threonine-protein kinase HipA
MKPEDTKIDIFLNHGDSLLPVGTMGFIGADGAPTPRFAYDRAWLRPAMSFVATGGAFSIDPEAPLGEGSYYPENGSFFRGISDSAPGSWGRKIIRCHIGYKPHDGANSCKDLFEHDYLLAVRDLHRIGALRFQVRGEAEFSNSSVDKSLSLMSLGSAHTAAINFEHGKESVEECSLLLNHGASLGGARPKVSVVDDHGELHIAKLPKDSDRYSVERWEAIALILAKNAGMNVSEHKLINLSARKVLLSKRFDREGDTRIPFMSAMARLRATDGEQGSYLDLIDIINLENTDPAKDKRELFRRVCFSILISNVDDHLRNHGFLQVNGAWELSPLYDVNPVPPTVRPRILTTLIDYDSSACSLRSLIDTIEHYGIKTSEGIEIIKEVAKVTAEWRSVAISVGATRPELELMKEAFEHDDSMLAKEL